MFKGTYERSRTVKGRVIEYDILGIPGNAKQRRRIVRQWRAVGYRVALYIWRAS